MRRIKILLCFFIVLLGDYANLFADKIEKKGTLLNASCKPFGLSCKAYQSNVIVVTYIYNDPAPGSFRIEISESEIRKNPELQAEFSKKSWLAIEEDIILTDDIITALKMPSMYRITKGEYPITFDKDRYIIVFKK